MPRALSTVVQQMYREMPHGPAQVGLIRFGFGGGDVRVTTAAQDISWDGYTWEGIGGVLSITPPVESTDIREAGLDVSLSGVDQSVLAVILQQQYIGRPVDIYLAQVAEAANRLLNSSLLTDSTGFVSSGATVTRDLSVTLNGAPSLQVITTNAIDSGFVNPQSGAEVAVTAGEQLMVSAYIEGSSAVGKLLRPVAFWYNSGGGFVSASYGASVTVQSGWQRLSFTTTVPAGVAKLRMAVLTPSAQGVFTFWSTHTQVTPVDVRERFQPTDGAAIVGGQIVSSPQLVFSGLMNGGWTIEETYEREAETVRIQGKVMSRLSLLDNTSGFLTSVDSHNVWCPGDMFFQFVPGLSHKVIWWGARPHLPTLPPPGSIRRPRR